MMNDFLTSIGLFRILRGKPFCLLRLGHNLHHYVLPRKWSLAAVCIGLILTSMAGPALADALVVTRAMNATTVAEIFIEQDHIRVQLEIGGEDIPLFRPLLTSDPTSEAEAIATSPIEISSESQTIAGTVETAELRARVVRDEITGDPLPVQPDSNAPGNRSPADDVLYLEITYQLAGQPNQLSIGPPRKGPRGDRIPNIGFVAYHLGLPINDFRYLSKHEPIDLNWSDPWFSAFENKNLRRQNSAPLSAFLYIEPFEVRKEIVVRPKDLQRFTDLGLSDTDTIPIAMQETLKEQVVDFLLPRGKVVIDDAVVPPQLDRVHFVRRTLRQTGIVEPPEDMPVVSATLGVIFVYPTEQLPQRVTMEWDLFDNMVKEVPVSATDEAGPLPGELTVESPVLEWRNYLKHPTTPGLVAIAPPKKRTIAVPILSALFTIGVLVILAIRSYSRRATPYEKPLLVAAVIGLVLMLATSRIAKVSFQHPFDRKVQLAQEEEAEVIRSLLYNVYRSFDRRDPVSIYDQLAQSVDGQLLETIYLDTRRGLEVENQGGVQVKVDEVELVEHSNLSQYEDTWDFDCRWRVSGSIGHWGHIHRRINEPSARLSIAARDGVWKIVGLTVADNPRVAP